MKPEMLYLSADLTYSYSNTKNWQVSLCQHSCPSCMLFNKVLVVPQSSAEQQVPWFWQGHHYPGQHSSGIKACVRRGKEEDSPGDPGDFQHLRKGMIFCHSLILQQHSENYFTNLLLHVRSSHVSTEMLALSNARWHKVQFIFG